MNRGLAVTAFLAGDVVRLEGEGVSPAAILAALDLPPAERPSVIRLAPGIALIPCLTASGRLALRWVQLPGAPEIDPGVGRVEAAIVLSGSVAEAALALRLVGRLEATLGDPALRARARAATRREELVRALAPVDHAREERAPGAEDVLAIVGSRAGGLTASEAEERLRACGANVLERVRRRPLLLRILEQFVSFFAVLLWVAGGLAFVAALPELGWAIFAVILINGSFSFFQEHRAERAVLALRALLPHEITVVRDGAERRLSTERLVPGDVVRLEEGDQIPADAALLAAEGLRVDQSALTGESQPVFKVPAPDSEPDVVPRFERHDLVFAGTGVVAGRGAAVVVATGMATEIGLVAHLTQRVTEEPSPLQREMVRVTRIVTALALALGGVFLLLGVASGALGLADGFLFALGMIVANVPEGLLPTLTLALAFGVQRMARRRSLVKRLSAVEALGATTVICTDKTGTLTEGRMAARAAWVAGRTVPVSGSGSDHAVRELLEAAVLASNATAEHGDPTEVALVRAAADLGLDPEKLRGAAPASLVHPFDSFRKRMTIVRESEAGAHAWVKGAPKGMLALCETIAWDGRTVVLTDAHRRSFTADHDRLAGEGLRLLAVARRALPAPLARGAPGQVERGLTLLGLIALWDPPRPEAAEAVALCRRAGIRVVMVTGDDGLTARAIARTLGLEVETVVTGEEVERMMPETLHHLLARPGILFARMSPAQKLAVVRGLKGLGEVVAVTGDGANDAPALKAADIGVAMGQRGTEVAKEAAEMVITDDNFASIVSAVREGRAIYANLGKFVTYIFASNVPEIVPFLAFVFFGIPLPLTVMQILAVDLGTDLVPALALGAERAEPGVMDRPPRRRDERLLGVRRLLHAYGFLGVIEAVLALAGFFWVYWLAGWRPGLPMAAEGALYRRATTMTLAGIVATQVGNVFACRTDRESVFRIGIFGNRLVLLGIAVEVVVLLGLIALPPLRSVFGLAPLAPGEWSVLLTFPWALLLAEEGRKWVLRRFRAARSPAR